MLSIGMFAIVIGFVPAGDTPTDTKPGFCVYSALAWGDFNGDGLDDAFVCLANGEGKLLSNRGDGRFDDITAQAGLSGVSGAQLALWSDVDGDNRRDLFLGGQRGPSRLFRQTAEGKFIDVTASAGFGGVHGMLEARFLDYDADGLDDLHLATLESDRVFHNVGAARFEEIDLGLAVPFRGGLLPGTRAGDVRNRAMGPSTTDGGTTGATLPPGVTALPGGPALPKGSLVICASAIDDMATGVCIPASSVPTLGMLYPISNELFVDAATGYVGVGTTGPTSELDVVGRVHATTLLETDGDVRGARLVSTTLVGAPLVVSSTAVVPGLNADLLDGFDAGAFSTFGSEVDTAEIANSAVTGAKIATGAVDSTDVQDGSLTSADLAAGSVGVAAIAANAVTSAAIAPGAVGFSDLATDSVGSDQIVINAVGFSEIAFGAVQDFHVNANANIAGTKIDPDFGGRDVTTSGDALFKRGVRGEYISNPTDNWGEMGTSPSIGISAGGDSTAVFGRNSTTTTNYGSLGTGLYGVQAQGNLAGGQFGDSSSAVNIDGARGWTATANGYGLYGRNYSATGITSRGVYGRTASPTSFGVFASGGFGGTGAKYFVNPHPEDPTKEIRFMSLEGNESGTYFRGTSQIVRGLAVIDVPEEFRLVTIPGRLTVQLTPVGAPAALWIERRDLHQVVVRCETDVVFDYFVNGVRRGFQDHPLVYPNASYLPEELGVEFGTEYPDAYRRILVENGILNSDFTPRADTLVRMEAELAHYRERLAHLRTESNASDSVR